MSPSPEEKLLRPPQNITDGRVSRSRISQGSNYSLREKRYINLELFMLVPGRYADAIKGHRNANDYKAVLERLVEEN